LLRDRTLYVSSIFFFFFFSSRRRHTRFSRDWSSDVCSSDLRSICLPRDLGIGELRAQQHVGKQIERRVEMSARHMQANGDGVEEIGRASCRERVEINVGAGKEKRKSENVESDMMTT